MRKGQALLVVLLVLGVVMTVGLSVASRSVTEVSISTTQEESTRALEAAETGIEKSLAGVGYFNVGTKTQTFIPTEGGATVNVSNTNLGGSGKDYVLPYSLEAGDVATISLNGFTGNQIRVCWGNDSSSYPVAEMMLYMNNPGAPGGVSMRKWVRGPGPFEDASKLNGCPGMKGDGVYYHSIGTNYGGETPLMLRIRLFGFTVPQSLAVKSTGAGDIPVQGNNTLSTGTSGPTVRKISVTQLNPDMPFMFDSALFSGTDLVKNN